MNFTTLALVLKAEHLYSQIHQGTGWMVCTQWVFMEVQRTISGHMKRDRHRHIESMKVILHRDICYPLSIWLRLLFKKYLFSYLKGGVTQRDLPSTDIFPPTRIHIATEIGPGQKQEPKAPPPMSPMWRSRYRHCRLYLLPSPAP